jgi:GntR family transcriptional regulator, carbon starvation induced regulator
MAELIELIYPATEPPLSEQAYAKLRADIIEGVIQPDEKLKIDTLQQRYSFSNTPLREALNRLAGERLVVADERRGFRAAPVSLQDFRDLTEYRLVIELGAMSAAIAHGGDDWEAEVVAAFRRLEAFEARQGEQRPASSSPEWIGRHKAFHMALLSGCMSQRLLTACSGVFDEAERYRYLARKTARPGRHTGDEHARLMEAALNRDAHLATALLRNHVMKTSSHVLQMLEGVAPEQGVSRSPRPGRHR